MAGATVPITPELLEEPHATTKHTLCGYAWSDVTNALQRAVGTADMARALRWSAELVCSEGGLGRLEAIMLHTWAVHVGQAYPGWPRVWFNTIHQIRAYWTKSGGDTRAVRNTPVVRQLIAEAVAGLVLAMKKPLPTLPTALDCFREAEAMRVRIRAGGGVGEQIATRKVWTLGQDGADLKTIGNELEAAIRGNQLGRVLFWVIWMVTLDGQKDAPPCKERGPTTLTAKQRKSILWFLVAVLRELANEGAFLSVEERNGMFGSLELSWNKLASRGRRDVLAAITICIQEHLQRRGTLSITGPAAPPSHMAIRGAITNVDKIYSGIAEEARRFMLEAPKIAGLTAESEVAAAKPVKLSSHDKLAISYALAGIGR